MYKDGQIIDKKEHIAFANWVNAQRGGFYSESNGDGTYTIHKTPEKELQIRVREIRNNALQQTDKYMIVDFPISDEDRETMKQYRQYLRDYTKQKDWWKSLPMTFDEYIADKAEPEAEEAEPEK